MISRSSSEIFIIIFNKKLLLIKFVLAKAFPVPKSLIVKPALKGRGELGISRCHQCDESQIKDRGLYETRLTLALL